LDFLKKYKVTILLAAGLLAISLFWYQNCRSNYWKLEAVALGAQLETKEAAQKLTDKKHADQIAQYDHASVVETALRVKLETERAKLYADNAKLEKQHKDDQAKNAVLTPTQLVKQLELTVGTGEVTLLAGDFFRFTLKAAQKAQSVFTDASYWMQKYTNCDTDKKLAIDQRDSLEREKGDLKASNLLISTDLNSYKDLLALCKKDNAAIVKSTSGIGLRTALETAGGIGVIVLILKVLKVI